MQGLKELRRALISVSDKSGVVDFAGELSELGIAIVSTGGTARVLSEAGLLVTEVADVTEFPEMMDGRVKTLHPKIHGAFLALRDNPEHLEAMQTHGIEAIDLVVVNLYPFEKMIANLNVSLESAVEQIDIGGPAMIRSASKNWRDVTVVTDPGQYPGIIAELRQNAGSVSLDTRQRFAARAYARTAEYDSVISAYLAKQLQPEGDDFPGQINLALVKLEDLRYGENPHQNAALYQSNEIGIAQARQLHGKEMSYNNYVDADAAWNLVADFDEMACAIIKHTNPSGVATGKNVAEAYLRALQTDPVSAFGGIVAINRKVDRAAAEAINKVFTEVVIAPEFDEEALEIFRTKKNLRILQAARSDNSVGLGFKQISGGMLVQDRDIIRVDAQKLKFVTDKQPTEQQIESMLFAWKVCKHVKSNSIVFANAFQTIGVGAGQMNRIDSVRIAAERARRTELRLEGSVLASDAFFPFRDGVDEAAGFGISAIIQPGGSVRDDEVIKAANEHGLVMAFTGIRHFNH